MKNDNQEWPPFTSKMENLSELKTSLAQSMVLRHAFPGEKPPQFKPSEINAAFVRLVDKAILEYERARKQLERYAYKKYPMRPLIALFRAADEFENCITSVHRAIRFLNCIKRIKENPRLTDSLKLVLRAEKNTKKFRDAIHHLDDDIMKKERARNPAGAFGIKVCVSHIENQSGIIKYMDLAKWIKYMHEFAKEFSR